MTVVTNGNVKHNPPSASNLAGQPDGLATLDSGGKLPAAQLPALAIGEIFVVADEPAMLALTAQRGDVAKRTDLGQSYILSTDDPTQVGDWIVLSDLDPVPGTSVTIDDTGLAITGATAQAAVAALDTAVTAAQADATQAIGDAATAAGAAATAQAAAEAASQPGHTHVIADVTDITAAGAALLDDATAADQRTTLGLGTAATTAASAYATAAQGATADSATQPGDLATTLNVSATDVLLGRSSSGAGSVEEVPCTAAGRALLDDADAAAQRATLGLGTAATTAASAYAAASHTHPQSDVTNLVTDLAAKAPLASPALTGTPTAPTASAATNTTQIATTAFVQQELSGVGGGPPAGTILAYGASSPPTGYLACDGSAVSRTTYATLFGVLGTTWGVGDGSTTFNLPDLRGRAPIGSGTGSGLTARTLGTNYGAENTTLTAAQSGLPSHTHKYYGGNSGTPISVGSGGMQSYVQTTSSTGGTSASSSHTNLQPSVAVAYIIKT